MHGLVYSHVSLYNGKVCNLLHALWFLLCREASSLKARDFLRRWPRRVPDTEWIITSETFDSLLNKLSDSGVGLGGIPYSAWRHAPDQVRTMLFEHDVFLMNGTDLHETANNAWFALVPKGTH